MHDLRETEMVTKQTEPDLTRVEEAGPATSRARRTALIGAHPSTQLPRRSRSAASRSSRRRPCGTTE